MIKSKIYISNVTDKLHCVLDGKVHILGAKGWEGAGRRWTKQLFDRQIGDGIFIEAKGISHTPDQDAEPHQVQSAPFKIPESWADEALREVVRGVVKSFADEVLPKLESHPVKVDKSISSEEIDQALAEVHNKARQPQEVIKPVVEYFFTGTERNAYGDIRGVFSGVHQSSCDTHSAAFSELMESIQKYDSSITQVERFEVLK